MHNVAVGASVVVRDPSGAEWSVTRQWLTRRPHRHGGPRASVRRWIRQERDGGDLLELLSFVWFLPEFVLESAVLAALGLALVTVVPTLLLAMATDWPWFVAGVVWLLMLAAITVGHPLLRVPCRRPWLVVAIRADQEWADRSAWHVRGWRRSRRAVDAVADAVRVGRGPYLSAEFLV